MTNEDNEFGFGSQSSFVDGVQSHVITLSTPTDEGKIKCAKYDFKQHYYHAIIDLQGLSPKRGRVTQ